MIDTILKLIAQFKVYFGNSTTYLAMANFVMILATFKLNYNIPVSVFVIAPIGLILFLGIGYLDYKLVFLKQATYLNKENDIKHQLNRIEEMLKHKP